MSLIKMPEIIILDYLTKIVNYIKKDIKENESTPEKMFIHPLYQGLKLERYDFLNQVIDILKRDETHARHLSIDIGFNMKRDKALAIHITQPGEMPGQNAMWNDVGYMPDQITVTESGEEAREVYTRRWKATYDIVIASDNNNEIAAIYHLLKALLVSLTVPLNLEGLENLTFSGQDLQQYSEIVPKNYYMKMIRLGLEYESSTLNLYSTKRYREIGFQPIPIND